MIVHHGHAGSFREGSPTASTQKVTGHSDVPLKNALVACGQNNFVDDSCIPVRTTSWEPGRERYVLLVTAGVVVLQQMTPGSLFHFRTPSDGVGRHCAAFQNRATVDRISFLGVRYGLTQDGPIGRL